MGYFQDKLQEIATHMQQPMSLLEATQLRALLLSILACIKPNDPEIPTLREHFSTLEQDCADLVNHLWHEEHTAWSAAEYPPAPAANSQRCWDCWLAGRREWQIRQPNQRHHVTTAVQEPDDLYPGGVRVVDQKVWMDYAVWRCSYGHKTTDGY